VVCVVCVHVCEHTTAVPTVNEQGRHG